MPYFKVKNSHQLLLKFLLILFISISILFGNDSADAIEIMKYFDGDTLKIKDGVYEYKLRLTDIDAPERNQEYGIKSRRALMQFC